MGNFFCCLNNSVVPLLETETKTISSTKESKSFSDVIKPEPKKDLPEQTLLRILEDDNINLLKKYRLSYRIKIYDNTFYHAILNNSLKCVEFLIDNKYFDDVNVNILQNYLVDDKYLPPIELALKLYRCEMFHLLIEKNATVNVNRLIHIAIEKMNLNILKFLLEKENIDLKTCLNKYNGKQSHHDFDMLQFLIHKGADINSTNDNGDTLLMRAINYRNNDLIMFLLNNGADVTIENKFKNNAVDIMIESTVYKHNVKKDVENAILDKYNLEKK